MRNAGKRFLQWGLLGAAIYQGAMASAEPTDKPLQHRSLYSGLDLSSECLEAYQTGIQRYQTALETSYRGQFEDLLLHKDTDFQNCRSELLLGAFDARSMTVQMLHIELLLELEALDTLPAAQQEGALRDLKTEFETRFRGALYNTEVVEHVVLNRESFRESLEDFKTSAFQTAQQKHQSFPVGRFVFTPRGDHKLRTLFEFAYHLDGRRLQDADGNWILQEGSFTRAVRKHWDLVTGLATEYLEWRPSAWFGEDSWIYGSAWRYYFGDRDAPSIREIKEQNYLDMMDNLVRIAREHLGISTKPHLEVYKVMLQKQRAYLERDIATIQAAKVGYVSAIFVPVGMALGSAGLAYAGLSIPAGVSSFSISTGAYLSAANVAAASSLIALVGGSTYFSWKQFRHHKPQSLVEFLDTLLPSAMASMPLAAVTPAAMGGVAAGGKYLYLEGLEYLAHLGNGFRHLQSLGWRGALAQIPKIPSYMTRNWISSWWVKDVATGTLKFRKGLMAYYLANVGASAIAEYVDREYFREEPHEKFWIDGKINEKSIYSVVPAAVIGLVGAPLLNNNNFFSRFMAWRILTFAGSVGVTFVLKKEVDWEFVSFSMLYGATAGTLVGDGSRVVSLLIQNNFKHSGHKFLFETLFRLVSIGPKTWIRNTFMEAYYDGVPVAAKEVRYIFKHELGLELEGFSDLEIETAFEDFLKSDATRELFENLKELP